MRSASAAASAEPSVPAARRSASEGVGEAVRVEVVTEKHDLAALHGVLAIIETLGLELVELRQVASPELVSHMVRAGELEVSDKDQAPPHGPE